MNGFYKEAYPQKENRYHELDRNKQAKNHPKHPSWKNKPSVKLNENSKLGSGFTDLTDSKTNQVIKNGFMQADIAVSGVTAKELRVIQIIYFKHRKGAPSGESIVVGKTNFVGFVDGGHNSPNIKKYGFQVGDEKRPYLYGSDMRAQKAEHEVWNGSNGNVLISDGPEAAIMYSEIHFETYIIASGYNNTKQDKVLAMFSWGFKDYGKKSIHNKTITLRLTNSLSEVAKKIIKNDKYSYKTIK